jgi:hypothetical protein
MCVAEGVVDVCRHAACLKRCQRKPAPLTPCYILAGADPLPPPLSLFWFQGMPPLSFQWFKDERRLNVATSNTNKLILVDVAPTESGAYYCQVGECMS